MAKKPRTKPRRVKAPTFMQEVSRIATKAGRGVIRNRKEGRSTNVGGFTSALRNPSIELKKKKTGRFRRPE